MENNIDQNIQSPVPPQEGTMPPFAPMPPHTPKPMRQRMMNRMGALKDAFPKWLSQYSIVVYILALTVVSFMYSSYSLPWYYVLSGVIAVLVFFLYGSTLTKNMLRVKLRKEVAFEKHLFWIAFIPRLALMFILYWVFQAYYQDAFGFEAGDAKYYDDLGRFVAGLIEEGNFHFFDEIARWCGRDDISDMGYGVYVGFIYWLTGTRAVDGVQMIGDVQTTSALSILTVRFLKCILSALTTLLIYRLAKRNFDEQTGRVAAIFCALWPNFWYYCSCHLKEVEMVLLVVLFVEQADQMLRSRNFTAWKIIPLLIIAAAMFTFRTPLGLVALLALVFSVVMSSSKVVSWGKRILIGILAVALIGVAAGNVISEKAKGLLDTAQSESQHKNMEWRGERAHGNSFAKYAGKSVFAPLIFTIPFPSMVRPWDGQDVQQFLNGGNFIKNILSCFAIFAMFMLLMSGKWRDYLLPLSFMLGYLVVLTVSIFAQSERFHQPVMPFELMFAAYGLSIAVTKRKYKRWFVCWCVLMFVACVAWNWFKLKGRGLI